MDYQYAALRTPFELPTGIRICSHALVEITWSSRVKRFSGTARVPRKLTVSPEGVSGEHNGVIKFPRSVERLSAVENLWLDSNGLEL